MIKLTWWEYAAILVPIGLALSFLYGHFMIKTMKGIWKWIQEIREDAKKEIEKLEKEFAQTQKSGDELRKFEISQRIYDLKRGNDLL